LSHDFVQLVVKLDTQDTPKPKQWI